MRWPGGDETGGAQREWYRLTHGKNLYCPDQKFSKIQIKQPFQHERKGKLTKICLRFYYDDDDVLLDFNWTCLSSRLLILHSSLISVFTQGKTDCDLP